MKNIFPIYILLLSGITFFLARHPSHNGDMPFYIVCSIEMKQGTSAGAVEQAKSFLQAELPPDEYLEHATRLMQASPALFDHYRIKPLYIMLVLIFHEIGFSYTTATDIPSLLGYFLIGLSIWRFTIQRLNPLKTALVSVLCIALFPTIELARLSTPDALSCFFLLNALLMIYDERNKMVWFCLLLLAVCTRIDNVFSAWIILFALWSSPAGMFIRKLKTGEFLLCSGVLGGMAMLINWVSTQHSLGISGPFAARSRISYLHDVKGWLLSVPGSFLSAAVLLFLITGLGRGFSWKNKLNYMVYGIITIVFVRMALYPFYEERFLVPYLLFILLIISYTYGAPDPRPETRL
jgi:hypothetical protein